MAKDAENVKVR